MGDPNLVPFMNDTITADSGKDPRAEETKSGEKGRKAEDNRDKPTSPRPDKETWGRGNMTEGPRKARTQILGPTISAKWPRKSEKAQRDEG